MFCESYVIAAVLRKLKEIQSMLQFPKEIKVIFPDGSESKFEPSTQYEEIGSKGYPDPRQPGTTKPHIGIIPRKFHREQRMVELCKAVARYYDSDTKCNTEWLAELESLISDVRRSERNER